MVENNIAKNSPDKTIAKGALVNLLGSVGKGLLPLYLILITRNYGPAIVGVYVIVESVIKIAVNLSVSGINDGMLMFMSREIDNKKNEEKIYLILSNAFIFAMFISIFLIFAAYIGGFDLLAAKYPKPEVTTGLKIIIWSIPFIFIPVLIISATKSLLMMKWDAILLGLVLPGSLIIFSSVFYFYSPNLKGLLIGYLFTQITVTLVSLFVFAKYFSFILLFKQIRNFKLFKPLVYFAIPQNINLAFTRFITDLDIIMLGYFNFSSETIAFYYAGAQIIKQLREIKLIFSGSYAPIIARLHAIKDTVKMNASFSMVSRWSSMIAFPLALIVSIFNNDILLIFHPSFTGDAVFMTILLFQPLISCTVGLSANILVMTGHSGWNLINSICSVILNVISNYFFIKHFGIIGAAVATSGASFIITIATMIEINYLVKARLIISKIYKPYLSMILPVILSIIFFNSSLFTISLISKFILSFICITIYIFILFLLKFEDEDRNLFLKKSI